MVSEFNLIQQYFTRSAPQTDLGVGDDAALLRVRDNHQLAISTDMLVAGTHFFHNAAPYDIGWKTLAVNVSDMAAMGATPRWATLAIALPDVNENWLSEFSQGFFACADAFKIDLVGGDTTRGPLNMSVSIMGEVPNGKALRRDRAKSGDDIWISGTLGDAALGLAHLQNKLHSKILLDDGYIEYCLEALHQPHPRVELGLALLDLAHSAIDISDGLLSDLGHILKASNAGAEIQLEDVPCSLFIAKHLHDNTVQQCLLAGGDDYELCFTAPANLFETISSLSKKLELPLTKIGSITSEQGLRVYDANKRLLPINQTGYDHFAKL